MTTPPSTSSKRILIVLLFFLSGFSGLIYQVMWTRQFKLLLGSSIVSVSIIVATFMAGLLIGSWWIGKQLEKKKFINELRYYGVLEIVIGVFGLLLLFFLPHARYFFSLFSEPSVEFSYVKLAVNILLTFLLLGIPTIAMGATLPLLINHFSKRRDNFRKTIGQFYSINALGGAIASLIAGFYLVKNLGIEGSLMVAIILNFIIGGIALFKSKEITIVESIKEENVERSSEKIANPAYLKILLITAFLTGFISIAYEVLWIRCINYILNSSTYTFSIILFVFLVGIAVGSAFMSYVKKIKNKEFVLSIFQLLLAISGVLIIYLFYEFAYTDAFADYFIASESGTPSWYQNVGLNLSFSILVFLGPAILMGLSFPLISELYYENRNAESGVAISKVYVVNTLGSILGALIPVFVLIPLLGSVKSTLYFLACLNLIVALYFVFKSSKTRKYIRPFVYLGVFILLLFKTDSDDILASLENIAEDTSQDTPIFYQEGIMATVKVYNKNGRFKSLSIDGVTIASEAFKAKESSIGHLPFFINKDIENVLAVGLASGSTVGSILKHEEVKHIDVVEIVPGVIDALDYFKEVNANVKNHPKVDIYVDDILSYLMYSKKKYDLISSDGKFGILNRSNSTMLSKDYYEICKDHLTKKGIFIQWISTEIPNKHLKIVLETAHSVFPYSELFLIRKNLFIISSKSPVAMDHNRILDCMENEAIRMDMNASGIYSPTEMLSFYIGPNSHSNGLKELSTLNTPVLEYDYNTERAKDVSKNGTSAFTNFLFLFDKFKKNKATIVAKQNTITQNEKFLSYQLNYDFFNSRMAFFKANLAMSNENYQEALKQFEIVIKDDHRDNINNIAVAAKTVGEFYLQQKKYDEAVRYFNVAVEKLGGYSDAFTLRGVTFYYQGEIEKSRLDMEKALSINPHDLTAKEFLDAIQNPPNN
jgi:spermidine synthase